MNLRLPQVGSNTHRSLITSLSVFIAYIIGLIFAVYQVPGVPKVIIDYVWNNTPELLITFGVPVALAPGIVNFIINFIFRKNTITTY